MWKEIDRIEDENHITITDVMDVATGYIIRTRVLGESISRCAVAQTLINSCGKYVEIVK